MGRRRAGVRAAGSARRGAREARLCLVLALVAGALALCRPAGDAAVSKTFLASDALGVAAAAGVGQPLAGRLGRRRPPATRSRREAKEEPDAAVLDGAATEVVLSSVPQTVTNLAKNIVGAGMLALPSGVAACTGDTRALFPAMGLLLLLGLASAYTFVLIADACQRTGEATYQDAWAKCVSKRTTVIPLVASILQATSSTVVFHMTMGDCMSNVFAHLGLPAAIAGRNVVIVILAVCCLFPLCNTESLARLAKFSSLGVASNAYIVGFVLLRALDGSYAAGGAFHAAAPVAPLFSAFDGSMLGTVATSRITVLLCMLSTTFLAHYNAPIFWEQLAPGSDGRKDSRFRLVAVLSFASAALFYGVVMSGGFATFGEASKGLILNSYAQNDLAATVARAAIACSVITGYPIIFIGLRRNLGRLMGQAGQDLFANHFQKSTAVLMACLTTASMVISDARKPVAFGGAICGTFLVFLAPAVMSFGARRKGLAPPAGLATRVFQALLIPFGAGLSVIGTLKAMAL